MTQAEYTSLLSQFIRNTSGQYIEYYGYRGECLSLAKRWVDCIVEKTAFPQRQYAPSSGNGKGSGYYTNFANLPLLQKYFTKESWVPGKAYPAGSLVVYTNTSHIGIFMQAGAPNFTIYEQNADPDGSPSATHQRSNSRIDGILVLKVDAPAAPVPAPAPSQGANNEMITTTDQAQKIYRFLRPNGGASDGEISGTVNKRSFAQFLNDGQKEVEQRDAALRVQAQQVVDQAQLITQQNGTITDLQKAVGDRDLELGAATTKIDELTRQLGDAVSGIDKPAEAPAETPNKPQPDVSYGTKTPNLLARVIAFFVLRFRHKK